MNEKEKAILVKFFLTFKKLVRSREKTEQRYAGELAKLVEEFLKDQEVRCPHGFVLPDHGLHPDCSYCARDARINQGNFSG